MREGTRVSGRQLLTQWKREKYKRAESDRVCVCVCVCRGLGVWGGGVRQDGRSGIEGSLSTSTSTVEAITVQHMLQETASSVSYSWVVTVFCVSMCASLYVLPQLFAFSGE